MVEVRCVDGSALAIRPVPVLDRDGVPYEITLRLLRDGRLFGEVGERCGWFIATTAARLRAARASGNADAFPASSLEAGLRAWAADEQLPADAAWERFERYVPRDRELFAFLSRDPDDLSSTGDLRVTLRTERTWLTIPDSERGYWRVRSLAVLDAWGAGGSGVRAVLTSTELLVLLEQLVQDFADVGTAYEPGEDLTGLRRPVG